jgi:hypothetical protein
LDGEEKRRIDEEVEVSSLVTPFKTNERIQEMTPTHFPWHLTLKNEVLSFRGKEGQLMFEQPLSAVEEAWWEPPHVLNLRVGSEHYSLCVVSPTFVRTAHHSGNGCLNLIFLLRGNATSRNL